MMCSCLQARQEIAHTDFLSVANGNGMLDEFLKMASAGNYLVA
jgi:hypothetical protein